MTSFAVNYDWTPELIAKDKELKEKFGPGAHITPVKTYGARLERTPEADGFAPKKSDKKNNVAKVAIGVTLAAVTALLMKKSAPKLKELLGFGKKEVHHAPIHVSDKDKQMLEQFSKLYKDKQSLEQFCKLNKFKTDSKYVKEIVDNSDKYGKSIKVSYGEGAPYAEGRISDIEGPGSKWANIVLNDGKEVGIKFTPQSSNVKVKFPEYSTYESADLGITLGSAETSKEAYDRILNGLNTHGYDGAAVLAELKRLMNLI